MRVTGPRSGCALGQPVALNASVFKTGTRISTAVNPKHKQPRLCPLPQGWSLSLALRSTAAPGPQVGPGTGFARAAGAGRFKQRTVSKRGLHSARLAVAHGPKPNPSIERTSNGGARWFAPSRSVTPLAAAHVKR